VNRRTKNNKENKSLSNEKKKLPWTVIISILISILAFGVSSWSLWLSYDNAKDDNQIRDRQKRTEVLFKLAQISQSIEDNITYLKMNMPANENCKNDYLNMITDLEKTLEFVETNYSKVEKTSLSSNALELELSIPEIDKALLAYSQLIEDAKNMVVFCKANHSSIDSSKDFLKVEQ